MTGLIVLAATLAAATATGLVWRSRSGRLRLLPPPLAADQPPVAVEPAEPAVVPRDLAESLGLPAAAGVTLLQFSSAFCAPCRATRTLLSQVAAELDGVRHVDVDAESHLDAVRRLRILRTPTVLILDAAHRVVGRASGAPRRAEVLAAVGAVLDRSEQPER